MDRELLHRVFSADGTKIVGRVRGQGPPLVLVHGGLGDGELTWRSMGPLLADRFTCFMMSTRGRALSAKPSPPDYAPARMVDDVVAFVEGVGAPVGLAGYSSGGMYALGAAARSSAISAVAVYEPPVLDASVQDAERFRAAVATMRQQVADGRLADAARTAVGVVATDEELTALAAAGAFDEWARNVPVGIEEVRALAQAEGPSPIDPAALAQITAPVLYMYGSRGHSWYREGARHLAAHVASVTVAEIGDASHFSPLLAPHAVAAELIRFLDPARQPS